MKKVLLMFAFIATLLVGSIGTAGAQVNYTVYDGTNTSSQVPINGYNCDNYLKCEYVIPADHLTAINGSTISKLTYYLTSSASAAWTCNFQVFVKEVASSTISDFSGMEDATLVYEGTLDATSSTMEVVFSTPYTYNGGNLLIGFYNTNNTGNYKSATFAGQTITGASVQGNASSLSSVTANQRNFIPKTTFTVDELHGCITPTNLEVSGITPYGATVTWTPGNTENEWVVKFNDNEYSVRGTPSYTVTGLNPSTDYVASVKAVCGDTEESEYTTPGVLFTTLCSSTVVTESTPFTEDFDSISSGIPSCWDNAEGTVATASYRWNYYATGVTGHCVRFNSYIPSSGQYSLLKTPVLDLTAINNPMITFTHKNPAAAQGFEVMYTTDGSTYTPIATGLQGAADWTTEEIAVPALANATNVMFIFKGISNCGSSYNDSYIFLDDVMVGEAPTCPKPTGITVSNITTTSADIAWTHGGSENAWIIDANGTEYPANDNPFTLTGLNPSTRYTVKVKAVCSEDDESDWSNEVSFRTECAAVAIPFYESFEDNELGCWTVEEDNTSYTWHIVSSLSSGYSGGMANGQYAAAMTCSSSTQYTAKLISPVLDLSTTLAPVLTFSYLNGSWTGDQNVLSVYYRTDANAEWTLLETYNSNVASWTEETISLPNPTATYQIAFEGETHYGYNIHVDAISIEGTSCPAPTNVVVSNETETSADVNWTAGNQETAWNIRYRPASNSVFFDFEDGLQGWTAYDVDGDTYNWMHEDCAETPHMTPYEGTGCAYSESYSNDDHLPLTPDNWLISPEVELIGSVKFMAVGQDASYAAEHFAVYVIEGALPATIDSTTISAFTQVGTEQIATGEYTEYTFDLSGHTGMGYVAIRHFNCYNQFVLNIDNITIGEEAAEWTVVEGVTNPYTITDLTANTTYEVQVQAACSEDDASDWTTSVEFTTLGETPVVDTCEVPANVTVVNNVVTWESEAENFNLMYIVAEDTTTVEVAGNTYTFEGLEDGAVVTVMVQAICDEDNTSDWSEATEFTFEGVGINNYGLNANVYPNPTRDVVNVECSAIGANLSVYDMFGKVVMNTTIQSERTELNLSNVAPGVYMIRIANNNATTTVKVVKR